MYADNYLRETANELRFIRHEGMIEGVDVQLNYSNLYLSGYDIIFEQLYTLGNLYFNYSHQMDLNSQLEFNVSVSGGPNVINSPSVTQKYAFSTSASYTYEMTDRLVTLLSDSFS